MIPDYICKDSVQCGPEYENVPWNEWENPRLIVTSDRINVLPQRSSKGFIVPARYVPDVLFANTTVEDWPMGPVVIVRTGEASGGREILERTKSELLSSLSHRGLRAVVEASPMHD